MRRSLTSLLGVPAYLLLLITFVYALGRVGKLSLANAARLTAFQRTQHSCEWWD